MTWKLCSAVAAILFVSPLVLARQGTMEAHSSAQAVEASLDYAAIAVMPVEVLSTNPTHTQLARAVHAELLDLLAEIDGLHVIDPASVRAYEASALKPEDIARQLGAATFLQSSIAADPRGFTVRFACIQVDTGKHHISGSLYGNAEWQPGKGLDSETQNEIANIVTSIEHGIFRDRARSAADYETDKAEARARFLDARLSVEERVKALGVLRPPMRSGYPRQYVDGGASLQGEVAIAVAQLATESDEPAIRALLWQTMVSVGDPHLVDPLLYALASDAEARVRAQAAAALAVHLSAPGVLETLGDASEMDPDRHVREAARLAMASREEQRALLRLMAMDRSRPDRDRSSALYSLRSIYGEEPMPFDSELATAMVELATTSTSPRTRSSVWFSLGQMGGAAAAELLAEALSAEPEETVRETMVDALSRHIDEPGVREALATAQFKDESPLVRKAAERGLRGDKW